MSDLFTVIASIAPLLIAVALAIFLRGRNP